PIHAPAWHVSVWVQASRSLHPDPSALAGLLQIPDIELQTPATWHWSSAVQAIGLPPTHAPDWQLSLCVQEFPSLHAAPSALGGLEHIPVERSHMPTAWHWSEAMQVIGAPATQEPPWHVSLWVQALPSVQAIPSALAGLEQTPVAASQVPAV